MRPAEEGLLLLCCALGTQDVPLTPAQYRTLARRVRQTCQAGDGEVTPAYLRALGYPEAAALQITALLDRTDTLHRYLEAAAAQGITVLTRLSDGFPARLRRMGETECPPALFCRGDTALLDQPTRLSLGFCDPRGDHGVHHCLRARHFFGQKLRLRAAERGLRLPSRHVRFLLAVHLLRKLVREHLFRAVDPLVLVAAELSDLLKRQKGEKLETLFHVLVRGVAPVLVKFVRGGLVFVQPHRALGRLAHLLSVRGG